MGPRRAAEAFRADLPPATILDQVLSSPHTRLPVYKGERENVVGVIHAKDVLRAIHKSAYDNKGDPADAVGVVEDAPELIRGFYDMALANFSVGDMAHLLHYLLKLLDNMQAIDKASGSGEDSDAEPPSKSKGQ